MTFQQAWERFWRMKEQTLSNGQHRWQWRQTLEAYVLPAIGNRPISDVRPTEILAIFEPIWNKINETARRTLDRTRAVFTWAITTEVRERANPCEGIAEQLGTKRGPHRHFRAMAYGDMPAFMGELRSLPPSPARLCLQWTILTACRSGEARHATWEEIHDEDWVIPAERTKMRKLHIVPLPAAARRVLKLAREPARPQGCQLIFPAADGRPLSDMALVMTLRHMRVADKTVVHGFRSSFRDWATEKVGVREVVAEAALAHAVGNKTEGAYRRTTYVEERRSLMDQWGAFLETG